MILFSFPQYENLARVLKRSLGCGRGVFAQKRFANGEMYVVVKTKVQGEKCLVLGTTAPPDENFLSLLILCQTLKQAGAKEIIALIPYLGYSRHGLHEPGKSNIAWLGIALKGAGVDKIVTCEVHSPHVAELCPVPVVSLSTQDVFVQALQKVLKKDTVFVAPDKGAMEKCKALAQALGVQKEIAYFKKERKPEGITLLSFHGKVAPHAVIVDDMLDTGGTLVAACEQLQKKGVQEITVVVTHGLFTGREWKKLWQYGVKTLYCTDSAPVSLRRPSQIKVVSVAPVLINYLT